MTCRPILDRMKKSQPILTFDFRPFEIRPIRPYHQFARIKEIFYQAFVNLIIGTVTYVFVRPADSRRLLKFEHVNGTIDYEMLLDPVIRTAILSG